MKKVTISDLSEIIAENNNISSKSAEDFVKTAFSLISEYVISDKLVKIKDLGTFKLVEVQERESIDVNTGERIIIPGHSKVSFTPDNSLRVQVNRPFADFQTVVLNEGVSLEEMEVTDAPVPENDTMEMSEETGEQDAIAMENVERLTETDEQPEELADEVAVDEALIDETVETEELEEPEADEADEAHEADEAGDNQEKFDDTPAQLPVATSVSAPVPQTVVYKYPTLWLLPYAFMTLILMAVSYFAGYHRIFTFTPAETTVEKTETPKSQPKATQTKSPQSVPPKTQNKEEDSRKKAIKEAVAKYPQVPGGAYLIVGTKKVREMKRGDTLLKMARQELGNSDLAQYIIVYNQFPNPDVIPLGYQVKIPELVEQ